MTQNISSGTFRTKILHPKATHKYEFRWEVENFSKLSIDGEIKSPQFSPGVNYDWCVGIFRDNDQFCFSINNVRKMNVSEKFASFDITLSHINGNAFHNEKVSLSLDGIQKHLLSVFSFDKCWHNFFSLENDTLVINISMELFNRNIQVIESNPDESKTNSFPVDLPKGLGKSYQKIYEDSLKTDIIFRIGDKKIKAHRAVLNARSIAFKELLKQNAFKDEITIEDISYKIFNEFLLFIYSGLLKNYDYRTAFHLYCAAIKYETADLQLVCANELLKALSLSNVCDVVALAQSHNDEYLKEKAKLFIKNNISRISSLDKWKKFVLKESTLASEISDFVNKNSKRKFNSVD